MNNFVFFLNAREICIFHFGDVQGSTQIWQFLIWQKILFSQDQHIHKHRLCLGNPSSKPFRATTHLFLFTHIKRCSSPSPSTVINSDLLFAGSESVLEATPPHPHKLSPRHCFRKLSTLVGETPWPKSSCWYFHLSNWRYCLCLWIQPALHFKVGFLCT